jgi:hypothetical protein
MVVQGVMFAYCVLKFYHSGTMVETVAIPLRFSIGHTFQEGVASVQSGKRWGYIDHSGSFLIPAQFDSAMPFCAGDAQVETFVELESDSGQVSGGQDTKADMDSLTIRGNTSGAMQRIRSGTRKSSFNHWPGCRGPQSSVTGSGRRLRERRRRRFKRWVVLEYCVHPRIPPSLGARPRG